MIKQICPDCTRKQLNQIKREIAKYVNKFGEERGLVMYLESRAEASQMAGSFITEEYKNGLDAALDKSPKFVELRDKLLSGKLTGLEEVELTKEINAIIKAVKAEYDKKLKDEIRNKSSNESN